MSTPTPDAREAAEAALLRPRRDHFQPMIATKNPAPKRAMKPRRMYCVAEQVRHDETVSLTKTRGWPFEDGPIVLIDASSAGRAWLEERVADVIHRIEMRDRQTWDPQVMAHAVVRAILGGRK